MTGSAAGRTTSLGDEAEPKHGSSSRTALMAVGVGGGSCRDHYLLFRAIFGSFSGVDPGVHRSPR